VDLLEELPDLPRVVADGDLQAEDDRDVVVRVALGDVRVGQPRDDAPRVGELDELLEALDRLDEVVVRELDALRRPVVPDV
jgi:DNA invertase Pin-like site-specific DNA recombinase